LLPSACLDGVGTSDDSDCRAQYPAYSCPCHRSTPSLAADGVWLRVGMVRYAFPVRLFHPLHSSRFLALSKTTFLRGLIQGFPGPVIALDCKGDQDLPGALLVPFAANASNLTTSSASTGGTIRLWHLEGKPDRSRGVARGRRASGDDRRDCTYRRGLSAALVLSPPSLAAIGTWRDAGS